MKKNYKLALFLACMTVANTVSAQFSIDFEDLSVPGADSAWLGSDGSGGFTSNGVFFQNVYDQQFGYWNGFVYSNSTDVTTPGFINDYSAYTGIGSNGSDNYAVCFTFGTTIDFGSPRHFTSIDITNTTYAAISMLNGDDFGKQFGSNYDAFGTVDGTNGEDWFKLLIIGRDIDSVVTDTVEFYLADYRFADSTQDYIVDTWETVVLDDLGDVRYVEFVMESSDVDGGYINTPAYFAFDNLTINNLGAEELSSTKYLVYPNPANTNINFVGLSGELKVFNNLGQLVAKDNLTGVNQIDISLLANGTYTYKVGTVSGIFMKN